MSVKILLLIPVTFEGSTVAAGEEIEVSERSAQALVDEGGAEFVQEKSATLDVTPEEEEADRILGEKEAQAVQDELERVRKALDDKYLRPELADAAKGIGVEFPYDAKKSEIIEAAVEAGKAAALLQL